MHTILNKTFTYFLRSLFAVVLLFSATSISNAALQIESFTVIPTGGTVDLENRTLTTSKNSPWRFSFKATGVAGCTILGEDSGEIFYPPSTEQSIRFNDTDSSLFDDAEDEYRYILSCHEKITFKSAAITVVATAIRPLGVNYFGGRGLIRTALETVVSEPFTVRVLKTAIDRCESGADYNLKTCNICTANPDSNACNICKADPNNIICDKCGGPDPSDPTCDESIEDAGVSAGVNEPPSATNSCSWTQVFTGACLAQFVGDILSTILINLAAITLATAGFIFENSIYYGVVIMSELVNYGADEGPSVVVQVWTIVRDVLNISVIFILLYLAIRIIIGQGEDIKKIISGVILFGVLTNFSLFFVKGAVDFSNIIALEFYQALRTAPLSETVFNGGVASAILNKTKINAFFVTAQNTNEGEEVGDNTGVVNAIKTEGGVLQNSILYKVVLVITLLSISFLFIQAAFMFLSRFIILVGVMIFSPLMFAGGLFTPLKPKIEDWWGAFTSQLFFAPIFFILLYIMIFVTGGVVQAFDKLASTENSYLGTFVAVIISNVVIIMGFSFVLSTSRKFSSDLGNKTAAMGSKVFSQGLGLAGGAALSGAAFGMRRAAKFAGADNFADRANTSNTWKGKVARGLGVGKLKDATFDVRNSTIAQKGTSKVLGALNSASGGRLNDVASISLGQGSKTTVGTTKSVDEIYKGYQENKQKLYNERAQARIDLELKKVEEDLNIKEHDVTDESIYSYNNDGEKVPIVRLEGEDDKTWEKKVKQANSLNKQYVYKQKEAHLNSRVVTTTDARKSSEAMSRYKANQGARKALDGSAAAKLQKYTTELTGDGTPANPGYLNILGRTDEEVRSASNDDLKTYWGTIEDHFKSEVARIKRTSPTGNVGDIPTQQGKDDYQKAKKIETRAKGATKEIDNLRKTLEEESKKK